MDQFDCIDLPRKKLKMDHTLTNDHNLQSTSSASNIKMQESPAGTHTGGDRLEKEAACGITEYVSPDSLGFSGILKKRYTDFLVNEILPSGHVVHLTSLKAPKKDQKKDHHAQHPPEPMIEKNHTHVTTPAANPKTSDPTNEVKVENGNSKSPPNIKPETDPQLQEALDYTTLPTPFLNGKSHDKCPVPSGGPRDPLAHHFEALPPHKRVSAVKPAKTAASANEKLEATPRTKQKVHIRRTSQGWVEVDEAAVKADKEQKEKEGAQVIEKRPDNGTVPQEVIFKNEISERLKNLYTPQGSTLASWNAFAGVKDHAEIPQDDKDVLEMYFTTEVVDAIRSLHNRILKSPDRHAKEYGNVRSAVMDRQTRGKIHQEIRRIFNSKLESQTDENGHMVISAMPKQSTFYGRTPPTQNDKSSNRNCETWKKSATRGKPVWKELGGDYLHFTLYKENKDTMESISYLSRQLGMKPQTFQFAGTKDRRGVTVQRVSAYRIFIDKVISAGRTLRNAHVGDYEYHPNPLQLGELTGNEFVITLRDCDFHYPEQADTKTVLKGATSIVAQAIKNLSEMGFINYYGLQRFGTFGISTDAIGVAMLQGDFKRAIDAILYYNPACLEPESRASSTTDSVSRDDRYRAQAIQLFQTTGDSYRASNDIPRKFSAEASIIRHLGKKGHHNDYLGALQTISRNLRLMYVHAYQSLIWNTAASERWRKFGSTVVEGDLVLIDEHKDDDPMVKKEEIDAEGEVVVQPGQDDRAINHDDMFTRARALSKEDVNSGRYTIFDIVLPTPGYDILYPANTIADFYRSFMSSESGGGLDPHDMRRGWKDISLSGSYRKLLAKPGRDIKYEIKTYVDDEEQFVETDLDRYYKAHPQQDHRGQGRPLSKPNPVKENGSNDKNNPATQPTIAGENHDISSSVPAESITPVPNSTSDISSSVDTDNSGGVRLDWNGQPKDDKKIAVILKLQLGTSQYATMALRELMKKGGVKTYKMDYSGGR